MRRTLGGYIFWRSLRGVAIAAVIIAGLIALVDFVEATRDIDADADLTNFDLFKLTLMKVPSLLEQTLPFIILFGVIGTLNGLNRKSELIAARAAGISAWRYLRPALLLAVIFGGLWVFAVNPTASQLLERHDEIRRAAGAETSQDESEIWLREATDRTRAVMRVGQYVPESRELVDVTYFAFDRTPSQDVFVRRIDAERAKWLPTGYFEFSELREWVDGEYASTSAILSLPTTLTESDLLDSVERGGIRALPPIWELPGLISAQRAAGLSTLISRMTFWKLAALPILLLAMALIGACVSMRLSREGGTWRLILTGGIVGFLVFFVSVFVEAFGEVGTLPPVIAAWTIPLVALAIGLAYLAKLEDG